jgi:hypothetical protein
MPLVDRRVVLNPGVGAAPRCLGDLLHELPRGNRLDRLAGDPRGQLPVLVVDDRAHELVGDANRVVRVLVLDREEAVTVDRHVKAGIAQRGGLVLLVGLAPDELLDVWMVDVEDDHLGRTTRLAPRLDRSRPGIGSAHEADRT